MIKFRLDIVVGLYHHLLHTFYYTSRLCAHVGTSFA